MLFDTGTVPNMKLKEAWELFVRPSEERKADMGQAHDAATDAFMTMELSSNNRMTMKRFLTGGAL